MLANTSAKLPVLTAGSANCAGAAAPKPARGGLSGETSLSSALRWDCSADSIRAKRLAVA